MLPPGSSHCCSVNTLTLKHKLIAAETAMIIFLFLNVLKSQQLWFVEGNLWCRFAVFDSQLNTQRWNWYLSHLTLSKTANLSQNDNSFERHWEGHYVKTCSAECERSRLCNRLFNLALFTVFHLSQDTSQKCSHQPCHLTTSFPRSK